jgi:hypothetical protein
MSILSKLDLYRLQQNCPAELVGEVPTLVTLGYITNKIVIL